MNKRQILERISQKAWTVAPDVSQVLLYGSRARGDNRKDSDWDILVLLDKERISLDDIDNISYPLRELGWELNEDFNTILYTVREWENNSFTPFYKNVTKDAIRL